jgi:hypothetical protein
VDLPRNVEPDSGGIVLLHVFNLRAKRFFRADKKTVFEGKAMQDEVNARVDKGLVQHHEQIVLPKRGEELIASQV